LAYTRTSTHKGCAHFNDGFCTFYNIPVDPNQAACPNFTVKGITSAPRPVTSYQQNWQQGVVGFRGVGRGMGMGRGIGMGRGGGRGMDQSMPMMTPQMPASATSAPPGSKEQEIQVLENRTVTLQQQLEQARKRTGFEVKVE
jgi:hypothetical protein